MKKKILYGALGLATVLVPLASCKDEEATTPVETTPEYGKYDVALGKPMMLYHYDDNAEFYWAPVEGAKGYVVKIDNGTPFGIGNPIYESDEGKMCVYVQNLDNLSIGEHKISFAAYDEKDQLSDWTDSYTFHVEDKSITLSRPTLYSGLSVRADEEFDSVTYDFGNNIKLTIDVNGSSYYTLNKEDLDQVKGLVDGQSYVVKCTIKKGNVESQVSNPITYKYSKSYYNQSVKTYVNDQTFKFEEELYAPTLTVKVNDKEYIINSTTSITEIEVMDLLYAIVEKKLATTADLLSAEEIKISVKVNYDEQHYAEGQYSEEIIFDQTQFKDFQFFLTLYEEIEHEFVDNKLNLLWGESQIVEYGYDGFVTFSATKDNGTEVDITQSAIKGEIGSIDCTDAEIIHLTVTYTRAGYTNSKVIDIEVPTKETVSISKVTLGKTSITWNTSSSDYDYFEVEIKNSSKTVKCTTLNKSLSYDEFSLTGDLAITVYAVKNNERIEDSKSLTINVSRKSAPGSLSVDNGYVTLNEGQVLVVDGTVHEYNKNYNSYNRIYIANASNVSSYYTGDYIYSIRSEATNYVIDRISNFDYKIEDGKYLVLEGYDFSKLIDDNYEKYLDDDKRFDLSAYYRATYRTYLTISGSDITNLSPTSKNTVISGRITFNVTPDVEITNDYTKETTSLEFETESIYDGKYEIIIEKYNEDKDEYEEFKTEAIDSTSYSLSALEKGKYKIYVGTIGNGYVVSGDKDYIYYIVNEDKVVDSIEYERGYSCYVYTHITFADTNLVYRYKTSYKLGNYTYSNTDTIYYADDGYCIDNGNYYGNVTGLSFISQNNDEDYLYKYLPSVSLSLTNKNYYTTYGKYCYEVEGYDSGDAYYLSYMNSNNSKSYYILSAKYEKNNIIYDRTLDGTVILKEAEGETPAETIDFISLPVTGLTSSSVNYYKYYSNYTYTNYDIKEIIVNKAEDKIATYLNKVVTLKQDIYVWKYQKVTAEGQEVDNTWYPLTDNVQVESIRTLSLDEDFTNYKATWYTDSTNGNECQVKLYKNGKAIVSYSSNTSDHYIIGLNSNNNIDSTCDWGYVNETDNIIYIKIGDDKKIYQLDSINGTISIYSPTVTSDAKAYTFNEAFGDWYINNMKQDINSTTEDIENAETFIAELKKVTFKISGDYVLRYYNNELMETLIVDIEEISGGYDEELNEILINYFDISYQTNYSDGFVSAYYSTLIYTINLLSDGTYNYTRKQ